jgi:three-Cys-motif partner protein
MTSRSVAVVPPVLDSARQGRKRMPPKSTTWEIEPHTRAKHQLIRKYLAGWMPALMQGGHGRVLFIDSFSGPGEYIGGEDGSPIIALKAYLEHQARERMRGEIVYIFTDERQDRIEYLMNVAVPRLGPLPANVRIEADASKFDESMTDLLAGLAEHNHKMAPAFAFLDPFGFSDTPMSLIARILEHPHSEVMVTVMLEPVNRFLTTPNESVAVHFDALFGDLAWRELTDVPDRLNALGEFYAEQLRKSALYVWSFRMLDEANRPIYDLFFGTKHLEGLKKMKRAMWSVDPVSGARFSDRHERGLTLFEPQLDTAPLRRGLAKEFGGQTVSYANLEQWVLLKTPYHDGHIKRRTLQPMEDDDQIEYVPPAIRPTTRTRARGTYPDGCQVRFR